MARHARLLVAPGDENVPDLRVALEIDQPVAVHPQHELELLLTHRGRRVVMPGRVDDDLARPARADLVVHADALAHEIPLEAEVGVRFGEHPNLPAGRVGGAAVLAVGRDLGRRRALGAGAEPTVPPRVEPPRRADQHPPPARRVLSQLAHGVLRVPHRRRGTLPLARHHHGIAAPFMRGRTRARPAGSSSRGAATAGGRLPTDAGMPVPRSCRRRRPHPAPMHPTAPRGRRTCGMMRVSTRWPNQSKSTARRPEGPAGRRKSFFRPRAWRSRTSTCSRTRTRARSWSA